MLVLPSFLVSLQPLKWMMRATAPTMRKSVSTVMVSDSDLILTCDPGKITPVDSSQGMGRPTRMSKMLEPMDEETAMSPKPRRATAREESASGMEVPAASSVRPITG